ncbi:MAG: hypothetical protein EHM40_11180 [Chloroflexi bacterium]|nr:MAG: hypothetical protein EHM40_11180 [Chloroflexota bacterium]
MILKPVGFFRELPYGSPDSPSIYETLPTALPDETKVLQYLKSATVFIVSPGIENDILAPENIVGTLAILTDGVWAWPESLSYYLENYHVVLLEEFLRHVQNRNYVVPNPDEINTGELEFPG